MKRLIYILLLFIFFVSCEEKGSSNQKASKVEVRELDGKFDFYVNNELYKVKGAGINYNDGHDYAGLKTAGANTFRTWGTYKIDEELKAAKEHNLMIAVGINLGKELYGFDYNNEEAVATQLESVKQTIKKYKNDPSILCWVVGNELNLLFQEDGVSLKMVNPKTYNALKEIVDFIQQEDPNHPVTTTFAGVIPAHLEMALERCNNLDFVSVQVYGALGTVQQAMEATGIELPYMVTEFGALGHWETPSTAWGREIEEPSGVKADGLKARITSGLVNNTSGKCLGGFAFEWGQKQERTPTWYGMYYKDGSQTERIDVLTKIWTGDYPENRAPRVDSIQLNRKKATDNIYLKPNSEVSSEVFAIETGGDKLIIVWKLLKEVKVRSQGGAKEIEPENLEIQILNKQDGELVFKTPNLEGDYRLFAYVYDGKGKAGSANIPFYVKNKNDK